MVFFETDTNVEIASVLQMLVVWAESP